MKGKITISRRSSTKGDGEIVISIVDDISRIEFVNAKISLQDFAEALTGLAYADCDLSVNGLDLVGLKKENKTLEFEIPECGYGERKDIAYEIAKSMCSDGWIASDYFSSQNSFFKKDGKDFARTKASRWVEVNEPN